jgi:hypothetical protein
MRTMIDIFNLSFILLLVYIICVYGFVQYQCLLCTSSAFNYLFHVWCDLKIVVFFCNTAMMMIISVVVMTSSIRSKAIFYDFRFIPVK